MDTARQSAGQDKFYIWFAGLIDGDGCLGLHKQKLGKFESWYPELTLSTTCKQTYEYLDQQLKTIQAGHHITLRKVKNPNWRDRWVICIRGIKRLSKLLPIIQPYLVTKNKECALLLDYIELRQAKPYHSRIGDEEQAIKQKLHQSKILRSGI